MNGIGAYCAFIVFIAFAPLAVQALDDTDRAFANEAAITDMAQVELANLAKQKVRSSGVRDYVDQLLQDHQRSSEKLKALASKKSIAVPTDLDIRQKANRDKMAALDGLEFEKAYIDTTIQDQRRALGIYQNEIRKTKDADFKTFATEIEPKLRQHMEQAQKLQSQHSSNAMRQ